VDIIVKNIKALYEEELCQVLLVVPDCVKLGREPESKAGVENLQLCFCCFWDVLYSVLIRRRSLTGLNSWMYRFNMPLLIASGR